MSRSDWRATVADRLVRPLRERVGPAVFGDRRGLVLFLAALVVLTTVTRVGIFITDTYTVANAFAALTDGHLAVRQPTYGSLLDTPGMFRVDGAWYGRNYGQIVASIPAYLLIQAVSVVADLRIALVAAWSLLVLALAVEVGRLLGRRDAFAVGGAAAAVALFALNAAVATPLDPSLSHVLALQVTSIVAAALLTVVVYRLVSLLRSPRVGVAAGVITLVGTPVAFWAPIPKRHVLTTLLALFGVYALAVSRHDDATDRRRRRHHAFAYAAVGVLAWVHSPEAIVLGTALVVADLPAVRSLSRRRVGTVLGVGALSLVPVLVTNLLITGDPFLAPRLVTRVDGTTVALAAGGGGVAAAGVGTVLVQSALGDLLAGVALYAEQLLEGVRTVIEEPGRLVDTFVRSGYVAERAPGGTQAINLAILESAPVVVGAVVAPVTAVASLWRTSRRRERLTDAEGATGLAFGTFAVLLTLLFIPRLPLFAQVTVRYLLALFPVAVVAVVLWTPAGRALAAHARTFGWALAASVLVGGQLLLVAIVWIDPATGEAFQFHALLGLAVAVPFGLWTVVATTTDRLDRPDRFGHADRFDRLGSVLVGVATATGFVLTLFVVTGYTSRIGRYPFDGGQALPVVRALADLLVLL